MKWLSILLSLLSVKIYAQQALNLTSSIQYVDIGDIGAAYSGDDMTIEALVCLRRTLAAGQQDSSTISSKVNVYSFDLSKFTVNCEIWGPVVLSNTCVLKENTWYHVAIVLSGQNKLYYVNGIIYGGEYSTIPIHCPIFTGDQHATIGNKWNGSDNTQFIGFIDELRIWNVWRTREQLLENMNDLPNPSTQTGLVAYYKFDGNLINAQGDTNYNGKPIGNISYTAMNNIISGHCGCGDYNISQEQTICAGNSFSFNGENLTQSGIYRDTFQTSQGCDSIITLNLTVLPLVQNNLNQTICEGDFYLFNGSPLSQSGTYIDTIKTAQNCAVTTLSLIVAPLPELVSAENYFEIEVGDSVTLSACASGDKYAWIANAASISTNPTISVSPKVSLQTYTCIISNETGCADTCTYIVKVNGIYGNIYVPNAFSPNGDGKNDVFEIFGNYIRIQHFAVFNRWGEKVYETTNANPAWNGTFKGVPQPAGVYTYELTYFSGVQSVAEFLRGSITLIQ